MKIGKVNYSGSFKGLWSTEKEKEVKGNELVFTRDAVYHPFKGESKKETENAIKNAKANAVRKVYDERVNDLTGKEYSSFDRYVIIKPSIGKPLNITKNEYDEICKMKSDACRITEGCERFKPIPKTELGEYIDIKGIID